MYLDSPAYATTGLGQLRWHQYSLSTHHFTLPYNCLKLELP